MLSYEDALTIILRETGWPEPLTVGLREAHGYVLAKDVHADRDFPPFDRSMVDGFAVCSTDLSTVPAEFQVIEYLPAGRFPKKSIGPGQAVRTMTGAPIPNGADAVVMIEQTEALGENDLMLNGSSRVKILKTLKPNQNISRQASDVKTGAVVIAAGTRIGAAEVGVLAAIGCHQVPVYRKPRLAILGTGDEIIEPAAIPNATQIRNSNSYQLLAQAAALGLETEYLGIAPDEPEITRTLIARGLEADVLVSTGGVSMGDRDCAGEAFKLLGVEIFFEKVAVKPGKPTTFGKRGKNLVFGLPGNPVAALVCFHLFVMSAVRQRMGYRNPLPRFLILPLKTDVAPPGDRPTFRPARLINEAGVTLIDAQRWHGSGDLTACAGADGLLFQEAHEALVAGKPARFYPFHF